MINLFYRCNFLVLNRTYMKRYLVTLILFSGLYAQPYRAPLTWAWTGRVHPELEWFTISTDNFNVHYHDGLEEVARRGATIAENSLPTLLTQMNLESVPTIDVVFTSADEVANGFATPFYSTWIWVGQNDASLRNEGKDWLEHVIPHELQHIVFFHRTNTWLPTGLDFFLSGTPGWVVEGTAEYETEKWRPYRADLQHKMHVLRNEMDDMDPHHDGFSKMLYWSDRFGDSTIVQTLSHRNSLKLFRFPEAFKKVTGISVSQFEEDWRRLMNTYYYGVRAQKEPIEKIGEVVTLPIERMFSFRFSSDSSKIALIGLDDKDQRDMSLFIAQRDTIAEREVLKEAEEDSSDHEVKPKVIWTKEEIDFGRFHQILSWSPDGKKIAYGKYHFGKNQASIWDVRVFDLESGEGRWLTHSMRANYPIWSSDGETIIYVAHRNGVANLYRIAPEGGEAERITSFTGNTQILTPAWSPDGETVAFSMAKDEKNLDLWFLNLESRDLKRITDDPAVDILPIWAADGESVTFTSHRSGTPNIHTIQLKDSSVIQNTDVGEAVWAHQDVPNEPTVFATTLGDVDTVRVVKVSPGRTITTAPLSIMDSYTDWRKAVPEHVLQQTDFGKDVQISGAQKYQFTKHLKHVATWIIPDIQSLGLTQWIDGLGRHLFTAAARTNFKSTDGSGLFLSYQNAQHGPLWSLSYYYNTFPVYRPYDGSRFGLMELKNGLNFRVFHPFNRGENLSSNHLLSASVSFIDRQPTVSDSIDWMTGEWFPRQMASYGAMPIPETGREALFSAEYRWVNRRPHRWNLLLPRQGRGFLLKMDKATSSFFGAFDYTKFTADMFINLPIGKTALYGRVKAVSLSGIGPVQDYVGLTNDPPIYFSIPLGDLATSIYEFFPENHNPRGWGGTRLGNLLVFGSVEYRIPVAPRFLSLSLISDFGNVWSDKKANDKMIVTTGIEGKMSLGPVVLAFGTARLLGDGPDSDDEFYFRLALINPF
ncbi:MAG: hypothetical protein CMG71_04235 [Candidatus Marinimicrobia bacterium]|mgnify:CR=1 FL=1|nr:hypothetical protein [Candidatus Neomarinimicrobiota bacterium]